MEAGKGGSNAYWPGFVDALTNVIIAMIFVVVVLAIALAFAAQMMGKKVAERMISEYKAAHSIKTDTPINTNEVGTIAAGSPIESPKIPESQRANRTIISVSGSEPASAPTIAIESTAKNILQLRYELGAITLSDKANEQFGLAVKGAVADFPHAYAQVVATGPEMILSDNQRLAFTRLMDVRNVLISQGVPTEKIISRIDTQSQTSVPMVTISFTEKP